MRDQNLRTLSILHDGREVPFKFLRLADISHGNLTHTAPRPVIVLLHGMGITIASFHGIAPHLFATHDLLLVDYNSFSAPHRWPHGGITLPLMAAGVWQIITSLHLARIDLVGSSLGGGLALLMSTLHPARVRAIALLNPAVYSQNLPKSYRWARVPLFGNLLMAASRPEKLVAGVEYIGYSSPDKMPPQLKDAYIRNMRSRHNRRQLMDVIRHLPADAREPNQLSPRLPGIQQPVLILWGKKELLLPPDTGQKLAADLPHATLVEFEQLAHLPHDEAPDLLGPIMAKFFNTQHA